MVEKIIASFIAVTIFVFFALGMGAAFIRKGENGKRVIPLPLGILMFVFGIMFYGSLVLTVLVPILRR